MALIKLTHAVLAQGRSIMRGFSMRQLRLLGITERVTFNIWGKQVIGRMYSEEIIAEFIALKDKHLFNRTVRNQAIRKERRRARKAGEEYRYDIDIILGTARRFVNGVEEIYRVGPAMTREEEREYRMKRMRRGIEENGTQHCWTGVDGKKPKGNPTSISGKLRKMKRDADRAAAALGIDVSAGYMTVLGVEIKDEVE
jgi:hypothetical protein